MSYVWSAIAVAAAILVSGALRAALTPFPNLSMVFLVAVLFAAVRFGMRPAIFASVASFLAYNFLFIAPVYTFSIADPREFLALAIFLVVAITTSALAGRVRDQTRAADKARAEAETERVRNTLLASISHDFRTPLASILGSATSLIDYRDKLDPAAQTDLLKHIKNESEGLNEMVGNLLAITRIDASALEVRRDWIDLREIAERVLSAARKRGATQSLRQAIPIDLPLVRADAVLIEQALTNIVSNAVLYAPPNAQVTIDGSAGPQSVTLRVTDDGPGIPADLLPRVFDKFARQRHADHREGTGLGLAIAKGIVEAHLGSINAQSPVRDGRGTCITMTLPVTERSA
jgi:two-component system sensor histidine kinase KdpD